MKMNTQTMVLVLAGIAVSFYWHRQVAEEERRQRAAHGAMNRDLVKQAEARAAGLGSLNGSVF